MDCVATCHSAPGFGHVALSFLCMHYAEEDALSVTLK